MDLEKLYTVEAHETGAEMQVKDQNGKDVNCFLTIVGLDSRTWAKIKSDMRKKSSSLNKTIDVDDNTERAKQLSKAVISWRGFTTGKKNIKFSAAKAYELLLNAPYIADQVDLFIIKRGNFMKG